ncbi:MAG: ATP-binding protein [Flavobacteriales bacterium]|nr:ATP-binding protein [Flavobacteriales bacterium]
MILEFKIKNFRSIKEEQAFTMLPATSVKEYPNQLLKVGRMNALSTAIVYGRNSSGKSNFLRAFRAIQYMVMDSANLKVKESIRPYEPFLLDKGTLKKPVELKLDFVAKDKIRYVYEIGYTRKRIEYERLTHYPKGQPAMLFSRTPGKAIKYGDLSGRKKDIENLLYDNQLYLSKVGSERIPQLAEVYLFFSEHMFVSIVHDTSYDNILIQFFTDKMAEDNIPHFKENINKLIRVADTGIKALEIKETDFKKEKLPEDMEEDKKKEIIKKYKYQIRTIHPFFEKGKEKGETLFRLQEESTGTIKLLAVGGLILEALAAGQVLVIDELDKSLHPKLTKTLIEVFQNPKTNPKGAQLIFATHDVALLDNELFRRDAIWFVEKEYEGESHLYSVSDISGVRRDVPFDKWYLNGRFGATPVINQHELDFKF